MVALICFPSPQAIYPKVTKIFESMNIWITHELKHSPKSRASQPTTNEDYMFILFYGCRNRTIANHVEVSLYMAAFNIVDMKVIKCWQFGIQCILICDVIKYFVTMGNCSNSYGWQSTDF